MSETAAGGTCATRYPPDALSLLKAAVAGPVLTPDDDAYETECIGFNLAQVIRPAPAVGATRAARRGQTSLRPRQHLSVQPQHPPRLTPGT